MMFLLLKMKLKIYLVKLIDFYQKSISIFIKPSCVFFPSCSEYAKQAIEKYGIIKGSKLSLFRILRCHPWQKNHLDPIP
jgi:putative membrane protein insertion efficiency factor